MKYCISALILLYLLVLIGCGGSSSGGSGNGFHAALCNDGRLSEQNSCTEACDSQSGVKEWLVDSCGPPPPLDEVPPAFFLPTSTNSPFAGDYHGHVTGYDLSFSIDKFGLVFGTATSGVAYELKGNIKDNGETVLSWQQKPDQYQIHTTLSKNGGNLAGICDLTRAFLTQSGGVQAEPKNIDSPFNVSPGR